MAKKGPGLGRLFLSFLRLGAVSFGGPAMVAHIRRLAVDEKAWLSEEDFRQGVALCQALPGATAMQCAAYVGLRARRLGGAVAAYLGFGLPAFGLMLVFSIGYGRADLESVVSRLSGLRALAVVLVAFASWEFGRASLTGFREGLISGFSAAWFLLGGSPPVAIIAAGFLGSLLLRRPSAGAPAEPREKPVWKALAPAAPVLIGAIGLVLILFSFPGRIGTLGLIMMKTDVLAFGGGLASIPLLYREIVDLRHWMLPGALLDGIALGQVTPGPVIITATFIGYQVARIPGALLGTLCIFLPSLLLLLLAEPWVVRLHDSRLWQGATRGLLLSFAALLASTAIRLAQAASWSPASMIIAVLASLALLRRMSVVRVVLAGAAASILLG